MSKNTIIVILSVALVLVVTLALVLALRPAPAPPAATVLPTFQTMTVFWAQPGAAGTATAIQETFNGLIDSLQHPPTATPKPG